MEALPQIRQTLSEIDGRVPEALRVSMGVRFWATPALTPGARDDIARFAAACLQHQPEEDDPMEIDSPGGASGGLECVMAPRSLQLLPASCYLPDHDEDMHFMRQESGVIGVADGVGGYRERGVDAAAFARALMYNAFEAVVSAAPGTGICPYELLQYAHQEAVAARTPGASTAVLLSLAGTTLRYAYVGDSAFAVFRAGRLFVRSKVQQWSFNFPFQLSAQGGNTASDAARGSVEVEEGDVVVAGTDGLFDNVSDLELQRIVTMCRSLGLSPKHTADVIAGFAYEASMTSNRDTPFSAQSRAHNGTSFRGGKRDDITVVVAYIV
ncbi:putative protein phosphatase 2C 24 [Oryza brachyantha]|uniref:Protein phosphatase n=1 Tax=Oryza brachyantha TaxID=4533 RepID=J3LF29_ORYBR|nr:putative protein phosphatase 2C 24 [Oryza brachyantha]